MKLLLHYLDFWEGLTPALIGASKGEDIRGAALAFHDFFDEFTKSEVETELYCDHLNISNAYSDRYFYSRRADVPEHPKCADGVLTVGGMPQA